MMLLLAIACVALCASCGGRQRPNVLILLMDTLRPDRLGCYGYAKNTSPTVDAIASKGTVFTSYYATADYTQASTASLFTGKYPLAHGYINSNYVLEGVNRTMAEILSQEGYRTAAFIANGLVGEKYHMDQGFDHFYEHNRAPASDLVDRAIGFIQDGGDAPFFMYVHFLDVHDPYRIPAGDRNRFAAHGFAHDMQDTLLLASMTMKAWWGTVQGWWEEEREQAEVERYFAEYSQMYDASIAYWDEQLSLLFAALEGAGAAERTIVIITSDHGEQLLEHAFFGHANSAYDVGLRVPFIYRDPSISTEGRHLDEAISSIDVLPTLLARLGVEIPVEIQGEERWSLIEGRVADRKREGVADGIYSEGTFLANRPFSTLIQSYCEGDWKLILDRFRDTKELYNVREDPLETRDLFAEQPEAAAELYGEIRRHYNRNLALFRDQVRSKAERQSEKLRELRALGYIGGQARPAGQLSEYFPLRDLALERFGPFGDEEELQTFSAEVDIVQGRFSWGQVIRGYSHLGMPDSTGAWFDRRATFLLRNQGSNTRVVFDVYIDPARGSDNPTGVEMVVNGEGVGNFRLEAGMHRVEAELPRFALDGEFLYASLDANRRFVLRPGDSPRTRVYGAMKIRMVGLEE